MKELYEVTNKKGQHVAFYNVISPIEISDDGNYIFAAELKGIQVYPANVFDVKKVEV